MMERIFPPSNCQHAIFSGDLSPLLKKLNKNSPLLTLSKFGLQFCIKEFFSQAISFLGRFAAPAAAY